MVHNEARGAELTPEQIEAGRLLFAGQCDFIAAANKMAVLPPITLPEVCFAGRSNVGKSSLVNALTGRRMLARTSQTPGRTRQLIFFNLADRLQLVDLPGYGYASAPKTDIKDWTNLTRKFLAGRQSLQRVFLLIDCRRGVGKADKEIMNLLDETAVSWAAVMTKADKIKPTALEKICTETEAVLANHVAAFPELFVTSSETGHGIAHLRGQLTMFALEKQPAKNA
ncbi:ribosome biogenesis GTP-binding protein YihA/YsxC [Alphaproteobacteria bacterium]|jgi:GTP-binding protein|nr:ribosome biogenesis GTP-binding protein YihA/YsxC [Alphaproteobacteria bacterium]